MKNKISDLLRPHSDPSLHLTSPQSLMSALVYLLRRSTILAEVDASVVFYLLLAAPDDCCCFSFEVQVLPSRHPQC